MALSILHNHKIIQNIITGPAPVSQRGACYPKSAKATHNLFHFNVPLQTREHALAGISGMLRSLAGAQGAFTSRGAKPKGLNLMLLGLTTQKTKHTHRLINYKHNSDVCMNVHVCFATSSSTSPLSSCTISSCVLSSSSSYLEKRTWRVT